MPNFTNQQIAPPKNWQDFEDLCADLWRKIWNDPNTLKNGRTGQPQHGVDVYGQLEGGGKWQGVQCKGKDGRYGHAVTEKELRDEVEKAKEFDPPISNFILATTVPADSSIQKVARKITEDNKNRGLFGVHVYGWDEIHRRLNEYPEVIDTHFPDQGPSFHSFQAKFDAFGEHQGLVIDELSRIREEVSKVVDQNKKTLPKEASILANVADDRTDSGNEALDKEIDTYRDYIKVNPVTALNLYEKLKERSWEKSSDRIRFRIITNIGATHLTLNNTEKASQCFFEAEKYAPDDDKAVRNVALAYLLQENYPKANEIAKRALTLNDDEDQAYALLVASSTLDESIESLESLVPPGKIESPEIAYALGHAYRRRGDLSKSCEWLQKAFKENSESKQFRVSYADSILSIIFENSNSSVGDRLDGKDRSELNKAIQILEEVWDEVKESEVASLHVLSAINLCNAYKHLNKKDKAASLLEEVLKLKPESSDARKLSAQLSIEAGEPNEAYTHLSSIPKGVDPEIDLMKVEALMVAKRFDEALELFESLQLSTYQQKLESIALGMHPLLLIETKGEKAALDAAKELEDKYPNDIYMNLKLAELYNLLGDSKESVTKAMQAASCISKESSYSDKLYIADTFYMLRQFKQALEIFKDLVISYHDSHPLRRLLICLYETDKRKAALEILGKIPDDDRGKKFYRRIAAAIYSLIGELSKAREESEAYLAEVPNDLDFRLNWTRILQRQGEDQMICDFLSSAPDYSEAEPLQQMHLAHLYHYCGFIQHSLDLAYQLRRKNPRNPQIHMGYLGLILTGNFDEGILQPSLIDKDTAFTVKNDNGELKTYIIENEDTDLLFSEEILLSHPFAKEALGKSVGQKYKIKLNPFQEEEWQVTDIKSKYIYLSHKTAEEYSSLFPEEQNFWKVTFKTKKEGGLDLAPLLRSIDDRHSHVIEVENMYKNAPYPMGIIAKLLGAHPIDVWRGFMRLGRVPIKCCLGTGLERSKALALLHSCEKGFVVDPLTLFSIFSLGVHEEISKGLGTLGITQSSLDLYLAQIERLEKQPPSGTIGRRDDKYILDEFSEKEIQNEITLFQNIHTWASKHCDILPAVGSQDLSSEFLNLTGVMDPSFMDTVLAANGSGRLLLSDDQYFRLLGKQVMDLDGVWLQIALLVVLERKALSPEKYSEMVAYMIDANMEFISINSQILMILAKNNDWIISDRFKKTAETLGRKNVELRTALNVVSEFLIIIWQSTLQWSEIEHYTYTMLNSIRAWKDLAIVSNFINFAYFLPSTGEFGKKYGTFW